MKWKFMTGSQTRKSKNLDFSLHSNQFLSFLFWLVPSLRLLLGFPGGSAVKNLRAMQEIREMRVRFLCWKDPWRRIQQPTPILLPGKSHGQRSLVPKVHRIKKSRTGLKQLSACTHKASFLDRWHVSSRRLESHFGFQAVISARAEF